MQYDRFQKEAIDYIDNDNSVIVCAPTGAGKTAIAEYVITKCIRENEGVIYTAPLKALSNQKFRDFQEQFQNNIGILTGDVSLNPSAAVLIMTTEIFRNKILDAPQSLNRYTWIIFDEVHYLDNFERGTVWEESLIFLPRHMKMLALSATIPNVKELADWISSIHKGLLRVVVEENRPVPLHFFFQCQNEIIDNLESLKQLGFKRGLHYQYRGRPKKADFFTKPNKVANLIAQIRRNEGLPCIYFVFDRRRAEELASELSSFNFLNGKEREEILALYDDLCTRFDIKNQRSVSLLYPLVQRGIAYHHAGMLPTLKEVVERLFTSRLLKVIFTTETFALGINMPARSVIFDELRKFYGRYVRNLKSRDFYQMAGRAGRRGMDLEGFVYCRINPRKIELEEIRRIIYGKPENVKSQLNASYATILNLYNKYKEGIYGLYPESLHYFQSDKRSRKATLELIQAKIRLLKDLNYIENEALTEKGWFARSLYGYELVVCELYDRGILEQLDEYGLAILAVAFVFEPRRNQPILGLSKYVRRIRDSCEKVTKEIQNMEFRYRIHPLTKQPFFHLSSSMEAWLKKEAFDKVLRLTNTDEGELIRYFRMALQILREIKDGRYASDNLKGKITKIISLINRDLVDAERQLLIRINV